MVSTARTYDPEPAARLLIGPWRENAKIDMLPDAVRPTTRAEGYRVQAALVAASGEDAVGWKLAATSAAGQKHIAVTMPLAGRLLRSRQRAEGSAIPVRGLGMAVAEPEFAFRMARDLRAPAHAGAFSREAVMDAVADLHLAIEFPDSRFRDFAVAGEAQLIADFACACFFVLGAKADASWRALDLAEHVVRVRVDAQEVAQGKGANVLGDPRTALTWLANELRTQGAFLRAGDIVITGTCVTPVPIGAGQKLEADFGTLGEVSAVTV